MLGQRKQVANAYSRIILDRHLLGVRARQARVGIDWLAAGG